jgi:hypothetical protein
MGDGVLDFRGKWRHGLHTGAENEEARKKIKSLHNRVPEKLAQQNATAIGTRIGLRTAQLKANDFFIEIQQNYTKSMEVIVLPPSFFIGIKN